MFFVLSNFYTLVISKPVILPIKTSIRNSFFLLGCAKQCYFVPAILLTRETNRFSMFFFLLTTSCFPYNYFEGLNLWSQFKYTAVVNNEIIKSNRIVRRSITKSRHFILVNILLHEKLPIYTRN